jgi:putative transposase
LPGKTTVKRILEEEGIHPLPTKARKKPPVEWAVFVRAHMETLIACDFFTKPVYTLRGKFHACVLVFIHLASRKAFCSPPTYRPDGDWVMQQARNAASWLDEIGVAPRYLIHDRDDKYPGRFGAFWKTEGVRCIRTPPRAPVANAFCECFIGKLKRECLDHFLCFSRGQLRHIVSTWLRYCSPGLRSHQHAAAASRVRHAERGPRRDLRAADSRFGARKNSAG